MALTVHAAAWHRRKGWSNQRQTMHGVNTGMQPGGAYVSVLCGAAVTQRNNSRWCGSPVENLKELLEVETRAPLQQLHFNGKEIQNTEKLNVVEVQVCSLIKIIQSTGVNNGEGTRTRQPRPCSRPS